MIRDVILRILDERHGMDEMMDFNQMMQHGNMFGVPYVFLGITLFVILVFISLYLLINALNSTKNNTTPVINVTPTISPLPTPQLSQPTSQSPTPLNNICPNCKNPVPPNSQYCPTCGFRLI